MKGDLQRLAEEVDLFYGDSIQAANQIPAVESGAGFRGNSLDPVAITHEVERESNKGTVKPWEMKDFKMTQVISILQRVEQPTGMRLQYQDNYRRAYIIHLLLDAWGRLEPDKQKRLEAGEWAGGDLRFVLAIIAEIHAQRVGSEMDNTAIVRISKDMPWIADPRFDLTKGAAWGKLPEALRLQP